MIARSEPSGDKLQLNEDSTCGGAAILPLLTSNRNVSELSPLATLYRQIVEGKRAHCTFQMPTSLRMKRGLPPPIGMAKMEDGVSRPADLGVEIYTISEPSGATIGCETWSVLLVTRISAIVRSIDCLNISRVPFRSELKRTAVLSGVQDHGTSSLSSIVSRLLASNCVPFIDSVPM